MKVLKSSVVVSLVCALLTVPVMAGTFTYNVSLPTDASALHERQMKELRVFAGLDVSLNVIDRLDIPAREHAQALWDDAGTALWGNGAEVGGACIVIVYDAAHNSAGIALSEDASVLLTDADIDAVEAAFASLDSDDPYVHVLNGLKRLEICALDGADVPACSYAAQYLRDPGSVPDPAPGPDSRIDILTGERDDARGAACTYLADEIGRWSGISVSISVVPDTESPEADALALRTAAYEVDPDTTVALICNPLTGQAAASIGDGAGDILPADAAERLTAAISGAEGDGYDRAMAGLKELASILFADGAREYDQNSGIALALDPDAFEADAFPVAAVVAIAAAVLLAVGAVLVVWRKKRRGKG